MAKIFAYICVIFISFMIFPRYLLADGSIKTLSATLTLNNEWDSNIYLDDEDEQSAWLYGASCGILYTKESQFSKLLLDYFLSARQNSETSDAEVEHIISLSFDRELTKYFSFNFQDSFNSGFDALNQGVREQRLYKRRNRKRYYTNSATISTEYRYGEKRNLTIGYDNQYYKSKDDRINEYIRHEFFADLEHRFVTHYGLISRLQYENGDFKGKPDTEGESFDVGVAHYLNFRDTVKIIYSFKNFTYRDDTHDYTIHTGSFEWTRQVTENDTIDVAFGASYWENDQNDSEWTPAYELDYIKRFRRGDIKFGGSGGFGNMSYSSDNAGLSKYWMIDVSLHYDLTKRLKATGSINYRRDDFVQSYDDHQEDRYLTQMGFDYTVNKVFSIALYYSLNVLDSTLPNDDFVDHRIFFYITAAKDIYRW